MASFVDTNVLVYLFDDGAPRKRECSVRLLGDDVDGLVISTQVLSEFYWATTRKLRVEAEVAGAAVQRMAMLPVVTLDRDLVLTAVDTAESHRLALWDALIVEAAVRGGCERLLTEDLSHGAVIRGVRVENPFRDV